MSFCFRLGCDWETDLETLAFWDINGFFHESHKKFNTFAEGSTATKFRRSAQRDFTVQGEENQEDIHCFLGGRGETSGHVHCSPPPPKKKERGFHTESVAVEENQEETCCAVLGSPKKIHPNGGPKVVWSELLVTLSLWCFQGREGGRAISEKPTGHALARLVSRFCFEPF